MMVSELVRTLLQKRGVEKAADIEAFISPDYAAHTHDPFLFQDMDVAVARIFDAIEKGERIAVYADFDCDGIPGASVLSDFFSKIQYTDISVYLPHRDREGYGFHTEAIQKLADSGVKLIITVDVGTKAHASVDFANSLGVDVIVTDHHEVDPVKEPNGSHGASGLPKALAVLNPKIAPYPFPNLCGAGVAFKLVQALVIEGRKRGVSAFTTLPLGWEKWLLDLVAIATVADMVPLVGENRVLTYWGLQVLRKTPRPGIVAFCSKLRLRKAELDETDIAFSFAPRINAASRMDSPELAFRLLTTSDKGEAEKLVDQLEALNASRKGIVAGIVKEAKRRARERFTADDLVVVLGNPDWKPSLLGLAANSIVEEHGGIALLWGRDANGKIKGSARSDGSMSVVELFTKAGDSFIEYGGHHASGGFSVDAEKIHTLAADLARAAAELVAESRQKIIEVPASDAILTLREVSIVLHREISILAPYGMGNPKPIFRISRVRVSGVKRFGKDKNHTEVSLVSPESFSPQRAFQFFKAPEHFSFLPVQDAEVDVIATLERDSFRGGIALRIVDILAS
jgi:single-stranded-DNA-specific exonuclease